MNESRRISKDYAEWFDKAIRDYVSPVKVEWQPTESYLQFNALFITFSFEKIDIRRRQSALDASPVNSLSPELYNVDRFYKRMCRALLGSNYARRRSEQPLVIAAADVNGTRYWKTAGPVHNVHIHSLWVFRPGQIERFKAASQNAISDPVGNAFDFHKVHIEPIYAMNTEGDGASKLSSYVAKFTGFNATDMLIGRDVDIYPKHLASETGG
ncbi:hypothetical protein [Sinorhizobium psoraleae]|uniref:Uncharacterized protein n=1 Tax=Sinorhizobium psoraleae TaxID=520838 RepID=A0ABT4KFG3_9HYPH|nr:hypothetical protein [Sinorhizobium psoraleae]MCZ4090614.1 hypothetical protein [Sinorhizobium psoraleae]